PPGHARPPADLRRQRNRPRRSGRDRRRALRRGQRPGPLKPILYLGCPAPERAHTEAVLSAARLGVVWADNLACALTELRRRDMPVLIDLSRGAAALQVVTEIRAHRPSTLMFAVVDVRRPDLTTEAILDGIADVFARPLGGRSLANAIARELAYDVRP